MQNVCLLVGVSGRFFYHTFQEDPPVSMLRENSQGEISKVPWFTPPPPTPTIRWAELKPLTHWCFQRENYLKNTTWNTWRFCLLMFPLSRIRVGKFHEILLTDKDEARGGVRFMLGNFGVPLGGYLGSCSPKENPILPEKTSIILIHTLPKITQLFLVRLYQIKLWNPYEPVGWHIETMPTP